MTTPAFDQEALRVMHKILGEELAVVDLPETFAAPLSSWAEEAFRLTRARANIRSAVWTSNAPASPDAHSRPG